MAYALIDYHKSNWSFAMKTVENADELKIYLPVFSERTGKRYAKKVLQRLEHANIKSVVMNQLLLHNDQFCDELTLHHREMITGRNMYKTLLVRILKDISYQMDVSLALLRVCLLMNEYGPENVDLVRFIAKEVKSLTVMTRDVAKFDMVKQSLFEQYGIILRVIKKDKIVAKNQNIIINIDFLDFEMNQLSWENHVCILAGFAKHFTLPIHFEGIVIRDIAIFPLEKESSMIEDLALCEAKIYRFFRKLKENDRMFERQGFKIDGYFGKNGRIASEEFKKLGKILLDK